MEVIGYILSLFIGISLGLIGGGGSILAVPVLAYLFCYDEKVATAYSLFIVGSAAMVGGIGHSLNKNVDWRTAIVFGIPAIIGVLITRHFIVPILPEVLISTNSFELTRRMGMFGLFSILMIWAAYTMLTEKKSKSGSGVVIYNYPLIIIEGLVVGSVTGFVGAGGGFLIIPALIVLANLEIKKAIGTSLIIIAMKSLLGFFLGDAMLMIIDWNFLLKFTGLTLIGIFSGVFLGKFIDGKKLKKAFGYFIIVMSIFIFSVEFIIN